jgi:HSP20 family protein
MASTEKTEKSDKEKQEARDATAPREDTQPKQEVVTRQNRNRAALARRRPASFGPFGLMRRLFEDLERLAVARPDLDQALAFIPKVDVTRRDNKIVVQVDLPGISPDDVTVTLEDGALVVAGERHSDREFHEGDVWRSERTYGSFQRLIPLPDNADLDSIEARFENGVLEISVRAPEKARGKAIEIQHGSQQRRATAH